MKEFLKSIGITEPGTLSRNGSYVIDIKNYDDYSRYFSLLEKSLEEVFESSLITTHVTTVTFASDKFTCVLQGDLDEDIYKLIVTEE